MKRASCLLSTMAVVLLTVLWTARAAIIIQPWSPIFQGVEFATGTADDTEVRLQQVQALRVDLADPNVEFFSTPSNGDAPMETFGQTTTTFVQTYGLAVGVNANFFSPVNTTPNDPRELSGLAISRGDIVSPFESGRPAVLITRSNTVSFATSAPASYANVWAAVAGSDRVLINGVAQLATCDTSFCGPNPRTAVGLSQNGRYFYLVTIDGRRPGWSDGATLYETGLWMQRLGAYNALNLDGGGSTAMAKLTNGTTVLLNRPSGGVQRVNGNHIGVFAPPLSPVITAHPTNATVSLDSPATFYVVAMGAPTLRYQWRFNGNPIPGATASSHTVAIAQLTNAGNYSVMVTNGYGTALSSNAALTVLPPVTAILGAGDDSLGQLNIPAGSTNLLAIAAGAWHSLALRRDGRVLAWGNDWDGQATVPPALSNAVAIAAGGYHSLALGADCRVVAWGADGYGQATVPGSLSKVLAIAAGTWHSLVLTLDGRVVAWGDNAAGQTNAPAGLSYAVAIAGGGNHSLAVRADGTVAAWGDNTDAQGNHAGQASVPLGLSNVVGIAAGSWHSLALKADGCVMAWGDNSLGQCNVPAGLSNVVFVAGGGSHSLALRRDGVVFAWGNNWNGQCSLPVGAANAAAIAAGGYHTLALRDEGLKVASIFQTRRQGTDFAVLVSTLARRHYALEGLDVLGATNWIALPTASGNGAVLRLSDPDASDAHRFYRVRQW